MTTAQEHALVDKLSVFISSRLKECANERKVAAEAVSSINHQPILFEHLGARPYSARTLYLSRLAASQFMVAIYRDGYGFIDAANGMTISGLEDELRFAQEQDVDILAYVHSDESNRDERLKKIISELLTSVVPSAYDNAEQLRGRIRDDLTAAITDRIVRNGKERSVVADDPDSVIKRIQSRSSLVSRTDLLDQIKLALSEHAEVCLFGVAGAGKTVLAAQYAQNTRAKYVRAFGLSPRDLYRACATVVGGKPLDPTVADSVQSAFAAFSSAWQGAKDLTLVVDECDFLGDLLLAIHKSGGTANGRKVVVTSREHAATTFGIEVQPLTQSELLADAQGSGIDHKAAQKISDMWALADRNSPRLRIALDQLNSSAREILTYLALSPVPLDAELLIALKGQDEFTVESLGDQLQSVIELVDDTPRGYRLTHEEVAQALIDRARKSKQRIKFYSGRLSRTFAKRQRFQEAYLAASHSSDGSESKFALSALRQAAMNGDWRSATTIATQFLDSPQANRKTEQAFYLSLQLSYALEQMGNLSRADELLLSARKLAEGLGADALETVEDIQVGQQAKRTLAPEDVAKLRGVYEKYKEEGRSFDQAKVGLELSAIYMGTKEYERSVEILRPTLAAFEEVGDEYGVDLAKRNLASSLIAEDSDSVEGAALLEEFLAKQDEATDRRRERAWICNVLSRQYRARKEYDQAEKVAKEAVAIAEELGDEYLRAINLTNLGNVFSDQDRVLDSIEQYKLSGIAAQKCGRKDVEAAASRLCAEQLNDIADATNINRLRNASEAFQYATHARSLLSNTLDYYELTHAHIEAARAQQHLGDDLQAAEHYFEATKNALTYGDQTLAAACLPRATLLTIENDPKAYLRGLQLAFSVQPPTYADFVSDFVYATRLIIQYAPRTALLSVLGQHVNEMLSHMPSWMIDPVVLNIASFFDQLKLSEDNLSEWRVLYSVIVLAAALRNTKSRYAFYALSQAINKLEIDIASRQEDDETQLWTLRLELGKPVVVSIMALDGSFATQIASLALATSIKAFEKEIVEQFSVNPAAIDELRVNVLSVEYAPEMLKSAIETVGAPEAVRNRSVAVSRPVDFSDSAMTNVFLGKTFLDELTLGGDIAGSLQMLLALTLVEIVFELLKGSVDEETIRPKVLSLIRRTI